MKNKYTIKQKLIASFCNENVEWHYATEVERLIMRFQLLSDEDRREFLKKIASNVASGLLQNGK